MRPFPRVPKTAPLDDNGKPRYWFNVDRVSVGDRGVCLNLGDVQVIAKMRVNGKDARGVWSFPFRVEIGSLLRAGENDLEIELPISGPTG